MKTRYLALLALFPSAASTAYLRPSFFDDDHDDEDHDHDDDHHKIPKEYSEEIEKGIRCKAGMKHFHGHKSCEAGMRMNATAVFAEAVATKVADTLHGQMLEALPTVQHFAPPANVLEAMKVYDDQAMVAEIPEGFSKKIEFGGRAHVEFGCSVTFSKEDGKFKKHVECGMKGEGGAGMKPGEMDDVQVEQ